MLEDIPTEVIPAQIQVLEVVTVLGVQQVLYP